MIEDEYSLPSYIDEMKRREREREREVKKVQRSTKAMSWKPMTRSNIRDVEIVRTIVDFKREWR